MPDQRGYEGRGCPRSRVPAFNGRERCNLATQGLFALYCINQPWLDDHGLAGQRGAVGAGEIEHGVGHFVKSW
mgnify:CR=1 FL=1